MTHHIQDTRKTLLENILQGNEPLFNGVNERVVRFSGKKSDVTDLSMLCYGNHILPIY